MADEIGKAMQKVGSSAGELKIPFEQVSSWIAVISSKTRLSSETIGDSVKSMLARMQSLKEKGFTSDDNTSVNQVSKSLAQVGIQLVDAQGNFRNFGVVMDELGKKWDTLTGRQKSYISTTLAGTYQQSNFLALMNNYTGSNGAIDLYAKALDSAGTAQKKFNLYQQGTEAQLNRLKDSWDALWMSTFKSSDIQAFVGSLNGLVTTLTSVVSHVGAIPTAMGLLTGGFLLFNTEARKSLNGLVAGVATSVKEFGLLNTTLLTEQEMFMLSSNSTGVFSKAMLNMTLVARGTGVALEFVGNSLKTAFLSFAPTLIPVALIMGIGYAIEKITEAIQNQREEEAKLKEQQNQLVSSYSSHKKAITDLTAEYEQLSKAKASNNGKLNTTDEKKYVDVQNQLAKLLPSVKEGIDSKGNAILKSSDAIRDQIKLLEKQVELEKEQQKLQAPKSIADNSKTLGGLQDDQSKNQKTEDYYKGIVDQLEKAKTNHAQILYYQGLENDANLKKLNDENQTNSLLQKNAQLIKNYFDGSNIKSDTVTGISSVLSEISTKGKDMGQVDLLFKSISDSINKLNSALQSGNGKAINDAIVGLESFGVKGEKLKEILALLEGQQNKTAKSTDDSTSSTKSAKQAQDEYSASLQKTMKDELSKASAEEQLVGMTQNRIDKAKDEIAIYTLMSGVENRSTEQSKALADAKQYLASIYPELVKGSELNIDAMGRETEQNDILLKALKDVTDGKASAEEIQTTNAALGARARLQIMSAELQALQQLEQTYADAMQHQMDMAQQLQNSGFDGADNAYIAAQKMHNAQQATANDVKNTKDQINSLIPSYDGIFKKLADYTNYQGSYYNGTTKNNNATTNSIYVTDKFKQKMDELNTAIAKQNEIMSRYPNYSSQYQNALKEEIKLLQQQKKLTDDQTTSLEKQIKTGKITDKTITNNNKSSSGSGSSSTGSSTQAKIWSFLKANGFSDSAAAGIMGNLQQESGFNTSITNSIGAYGLAQWLGGRKTGLKNYAKSKGKSSSDLETQLEYLLKEMKNGELNNLSSFKKTGNASEAARIFEAQFERSGGSAVGTREAYANQIYNKYKGTKGSSGSGGSSSGNKNIDDAKSEVNQLKQSSLDIQKQIQQAYDALIQSVEAGYEHTVAGYDRTIKNSQLFMARYKEGSKSWISEVNKQISAMSGQNKATQDEINSLEKLRKSEGLSALQKEQLKDKINDLKTAQLEYVNAIADADKQIRESQINAKIKETTDLYNKEIDKLQAQLDKLQNQSTNLQNEIDKAKSDKRYETIDKNGNVVLTYDHAKVDDLEKQKKEADLQQQIADEEKKRDAAIQKLTDLQDKYTYKNYQNIADLKKIMQDFTKDLDKTFKNGLPIKKHHTGGIIGSSSSPNGSLIDRLFNVNSNEEVIKGLKGEVVINPMLPNVQSNFNRMLGALSFNPIAVPTGTNINYNMSNFTIQANNPKELLSELEMIVRMHKS